MQQTTSTLQDKIVIGELHPVPGFQLAGVASGLRKNNRLDMALIASDENCNAAGVFTTNQVKAAPVLLDMEHIKYHASEIRAVVVNAANANACTGKLGLKNAKHTAEWVAEEIGCRPEQVLILSTGVIGVQLPMDKIASGVQKAGQALTTDAWSDAATAIMTTDTRPKAVSKQCGGYTITGIAKGSGMIAPNMATMLSVITTDATIEQPLLQETLQDVVNVSFNRISVDGDTSTNDTVLLLANGASGKTIRSEDKLNHFKQALTEVCTELSQMIVRDGEGATKFITIQITGAADRASAYQVANTIATSPLVKTAFYGGDANWGRIMMAAGRAGVTLQQEKLNLWFAEGFTSDDGLQVVQNGTPTDYSEATATEIFAAEEITVHLDLGLGNHHATVWTCDLSHDYVSINADYRT